MNLRHLLSKLLPTWSGDLRTPSAGRPRQLGGVELLEARVVLSVAGHASELFDRASGWEPVEPVGPALFLSDHQAWGANSSLAYTLDHPQGPVAGPWLMFAERPLGQAVANDFAYGNEYRFAEPDRSTARESVFDLPNSAFHVSTISIPLVPAIETDGHVSVRSDLSVSALRSDPPSGLLASSQQGEGEYSRPFISIVITTIRIPVYNSPANTSPPAWYASANSPRPFETSTGQSQQRIAGNSSYFQSLLAADDNSTCGLVSGEPNFRIDTNSSPASSAGVTTTRLHHRSNFVVAPGERSESSGDQQLATKADSADDSAGLIELTPGAESLAGKRKTARNMSLRDQTAPIDGSLHTISAAWLTNEGARPDRLPINWPSENAIAAEPVLLNAWSPEQEGLIELLAADLAQLNESFGSAARQSSAAFGALPPAGLETASDSYQAFELSAGEAPTAAPEVPAAAPRQDQFVSAEARVD